MHQLVELAEAVQRGRGRLHERLHLGLGRAGEHAEERGAGERVDDEALLLRVARVRVHHLHTKGNLAAAVLLLIVRCC